MKRPSFARKKFNGLIVASSLTMVVSFVMFLIDSIVAGNILGEEAISAINIVMPVFSIANFISGIIGLGTSYAYSEALGKDDKAYADRLWGQSVILAAAAGIIMFACMTVCRDMFLNFMDISTAVRIHAENYWKYEQWVVLLLPMAFLLQVMITNDYDEKLLTAANIALFAGHAGIAVFFTEKLGCGGTALGMVIGCALCIGILCLHFFRKTNTLKFRWSCSVKDMLLITKLSLVDAVIYLCMGVAGFVLNRFVAHEFGDLYLPVLSLALGAVEFTILFDGVGNAVSPLANLYYGEKNSVAEYGLISYAMKVAVIEGITLAALVLICAPLILKMYSITDPAIVPSCLAAVRILALSLPLTAVKYIMTSQYLYVRKIKLSVGLTLANDLAATTVFSVLLGKLFGLSGTWWGFVLAAPVVLTCFGIYTCRRYGRDSFPYLVNGKSNTVFNESFCFNESEIVRVRDRIGEFLRNSSVEPSDINRVMLIIEEAALLIRQENDKKDLLGEVTVCIEENRIVLHIKDDGKIFDVTDINAGTAASQNILYRKMLELKIPRTYLPAAGSNRATYTIERTGTQISQQACVHHKGD